MFVLYLIANWCPRYPLHRIFWQNRLMSYSLLSEVPEHLVQVFWLNEQTQSEEEEENVTGKDRVKNNIELKIHQVINVERAQLFTCC